MTVLLSFYQYDVTEFDGDLNDATVCKEMASRFDAIKYLFFNFLQPRVDVSTLSEWMLDIGLKDSSAIEEFFTVEDAFEFLLECEIAIAQKVLDKYFADVKSGNVIAGYSIETQ